MSLLTLPKPDEAILGRRDEFIRQLRKLAPNATLITDSEGRRTFETDALTAYRCMPLAVILPESTEEVSAITESGIIALGSAIHLSMFSSVHTKPSSPSFFMPAE